jgi:hypothetical protein
LTKLQRRAILVASLELNFIMEAIKEEKLSPGVCLKRYFREILPGLLGAQLGAAREDGTIGKIREARTQLPAVIEAMGSVSPCRECDGQVARCGVSAAVGDTIYSAARPSDNPNGWTHFISVSENQAQ